MADALDPFRRLLIPFGNIDRDLLSKKAVQTLHGRDFSLLRELWIEAEPGGHISVTACFSPDPRQTLAISSTQSFVRLRRLSDIAMARSAGIVLAEHFAVPLVDHTDPGDAA